MRSVGSEILSVATVLSIPLGIAFAFPFGALGFKAAADLPHPVHAAFVEMTPEVESQALRTVRTAWRGESGGIRHLRADLFCEQLPEDGQMSVLSVRERSRLPALPEIRCGRTPFLPSQRAQPPSPLPADKKEASQTFSREELLKLN